MTALATVKDPELDLPLTEMGLIYDVRVGDDGYVTVVMTLTTIGCPLYDVIRADIEHAVRSVDGVTDVTVDLTFDPPWDPSMMTPSARASVGLA